MKQFRKISFLFVFVFLFFVTACAEKKYVKLSGQEGAGSQKATADCSFKFSQSGLCLSWQWRRQPTNMKPGVIDFRVYSLDPSDQFPQLVDVNDPVDLVLWMPAMGHGSSPVQVNKLDVGTYEALNVLFVMPGLWEMKFQITDDKGVVDEVVVPINI